MHLLRTVAALSVAALLGAFANPGPLHVASPSSSTAAMAMGASGPMAKPDSSLMHTMTDRMPPASTVK